MLVTFPDVEALCVTAINAGFTSLSQSVTAHTKVPTPRPDEFVRVLSSGGQDETMVTDSVLLTLEGWALTESRAREICDIARAILRAQDAEIRGARGFSHPQNLPDPESNQARYTSTGDVRVWGTTTP